ncbi:PRC-barrel domain-containing protein [Rhizosaccharibacter radicis]|uniref:PRC-barrel domain-containing protein n=1 Tax=Rhizosaccharibacter radicis TaxID=2782605 RepID=A0ABT1W1C2_9PROT|nr:PRC-barrel domain-containing protein [Acetobacteraceae bacterium KSS12]
MGAPVPGDATSSSASPAAASPPPAASASTPAGGTAGTSQTGAAPAQGTAPGAASSGAPAAGGPTAAAPDNGAASSGSPSPGGSSSGAASPGAAGPGTGTPAGGVGTAGAPGAPTGVSAAHDGSAKPADKKPAEKNDELPKLALAKRHLGPLLDRAVRSTENREVGRVIDVLVDEQGQPAALVLDVGGFMGVGNRRIAIAWERFRTGGLKSGDPIRVALSEAEVKSAPAYDGSADATVVMGPGDGSGAPDASPTVPAKQPAGTSAQDPATRVDVAIPAVAVPVPGGNGASAAIGADPAPPSAPGQGAHSAHPDALPADGGITPPAAGSPAPTRATPAGDGGPTAPRPTPGRPDGARDGHPERMDGATVSPVPPGRGQGAGSAGEGIPAADDPAASHGRSETPKAAPHAAAPVATPADRSVPSASGGS